MAIDPALDQALTDQNPWHRTGTVPRPLARRTERALGRGLWRELLADSPRRFQLVLGPRRVGKTTALYQTVRHLIDDAALVPSRIWWLRLDHPVLLRHELGDIVRTLVERTEANESAPVFLMLDELVYAKEWDLWLKTFHDERWPVRIAATSSATAALRDRRLESGVGRWTERYLMPYLFSEFLDLREIPATMDGAESLAATLLDEKAMTLETGANLASWRRLFMLVGGFPELLFAIAREPDDEIDELLESQQVLRADAVERAVYKDIPQSFKVDNPMMLERTLYVLAAEFTGLLSPSRLGKELELSQPTFDRYLAYLEQAFLVFTLTNYSGREASVQKRGRKLYFLDGAIRNAVLQRGLSPLDDQREMGRLLENLVAATLRAFALHTGTRLHYWREKKHEIDFVLDVPGAPLAIEIGSSDTHPRTGSMAFVERHPRFAGRTWFVSPNSPVLSPTKARSGVGSLPLDTFLLAVSRAAERSMTRGGDTASAIGSRDVERSARPPSRK